MRTPFVSVIIIGRNEGARLRECLRAVRAMHYPQDRLEILYVDSHSTDDSLAVARQEGAEAMALPPGPTTAARGRNAGIRLAKGELLLFLDGDTIVLPDFLAHALAFLSDHPDVAVYWGHRRELYPEHSIYNRVFDLDWLFPSGESAYCGGDAVMRRAVLEQVGLFRDDLIAGEEPELCARIRTAGHRIWHADELMTRHDIAVTSFSAYWRRCYRGGHAYAEVAERTNGTLFRSESLRNHRQIAIYVGAPSLLIAVFGWAGLWIALAAAIAIVLRSAWRSRWRKASLPTTLLYACHSHFCQLPIWLGQLAYHWHRRRQIQRLIIEYK